MAIKAHDLGFAYGTLIEDTDRGTVQYRAPATFIPAFSVRIADVTGVSGQKKGLLKISMRVHGQGTVLAEVDVNHGTTEKVADWFNSRIGLGATRTSSVEAASPVADQIERLAALHTQGLLTAEEFAAAKRKIVGL